MSGRVLVQHGGTVGPGRSQPMFFVDGQKRLLAPSSDVDEFTEVCSGKPGFEPWFSLLANCCLHWYSYLPARARPHSKGGWHPLI